MICLLDLLRRLAYASDSNLVIGSGLHAELFLSLDNGYPVMPSLNLERIFVAVVILPLFQLPGCGKDGALEHYSPRSLADKPAQSQEGRPASEASSAMRSSSVAGETAAHPLDLHEVCGTICDLFGGIPGTEVRRAAGGSDDSLSETEQSECHVEASGRFSALEGDNPTEPVRKKFEAMGWKEQLQLAADGPDGTSFAFRKSQVLCQFRGAWDGGDDSDPDYEPSDEYRISATCVRSPRR